MKFRKVPEILSRISGQLTEAQKQNGLYKLKGQKQYNGTYIIVSQRADAAGKIAVANEPFINQEVGEPYGKFYYRDSPEPLWKKCRMEWIQQHSRKEMDGGRYSGVDGCSENRIRYAF